MRNSAFTIFKKELNRFFQDRRTLFTVVLLPGLMIYLLYSFMGSAIADQSATAEQYKPSVQVVGLPESLSPAFKGTTDKLKEIDASKLRSAKKAVTDGELDLCIVFPENFDGAVANYSPTSGSLAPNVEIYFNSSSANSQTAHLTFTALLDSYESSMANKFDVNREDAEFDLVTEQDSASTVFASLLPMLLLIFMFSGCSGVAPESIAGEKERGTIATLLVTPARRRDIAIGKITALSIIALLSGISSAAGTILSLPKIMGPNESLDSSVYGPTEYALLGLVIVATVLLMIAVISVVSTFAKSVKEAQTYVMPLMIVIVLIGITASLGDGAKTELFYYLIPIYNSVQCMVGIFSFDFNASQIALCFISNLCYTGISIYVLTKMFNSEHVMFSK